MKGMEGKSGGGARQDRALGSLNADDAVKVVTEADTDPGTARSSEHLAGDMVLIDTGDEARLSRSDLGRSEVELRRTAGQPLRVCSGSRTRIVCGHHSTRSWRWREVILVVLVLVDAAVTTARGLQISARWCAITLTPRLGMVVAAPRGKSFTASRCGETFCTGRGVRRR